MWLFIDQLIASSELPPVRFPYKWAGCLGLLAAEMEIEYVWQIQGVYEKESRPFTLSLIGCIRLASGM